MKVVLDSGPVGLATNPMRSPETIACEMWLKNHIKQGHEIILPEIIDYEGQTYIAVLLPTLKGIQIAKLKFAPKP